MNQFGLIIQETTAGSNLQFVSPNLNADSPEIKSTLTDERTLACQLANLSDVYSVQITQTYKVYSLIVTNFTDFLGRAGYYAIRLYAPKNIILPNFETTLANVQQQYSQFSASGTLNNQNYDNILQSMLGAQQHKKNYVTLKTSAVYSFYFDDANSELSQVFNAPVTFLAHKIYAFNKNKAVPENIASSSGLKSFVQLHGSLREIQIANNYSNLNTISVNEQALEFNAGLNELYLLCQNTDQVRYNTTDDKVFKLITHNFVSVMRKPMPGPGSSGNYRPVPRGKKKHTEVYIISSLMMLIIGLGIYFVTMPGEEITPPTPTPPAKPPVEITTSIIKDSTPKSVFNFKDTIDGKGRKCYTSTHNKIKDYTFIFSGEKWAYIKNVKPNKPMAFNTSVLEKEIELTTKEITSFKTELEKISKIPLSDNPVGPAAPPGTRAANNVKGATTSPGKNEGPNKDPSFSM